MWVIIAKYNVKKVGLGNIWKEKVLSRIFHENAWWFSIIDVISTLTDSVNPRDYWYKMKIRVKSEESAELSTFCRQLKLKAPDGKLRETDCANTESLFLIILFPK